MDEITKFHGEGTIQTKKSNDGIWTHITASDGSYYLLANDDEVADSNTTLQSFSGEYLIGNSYDSALKDVAELFEWQMTSPDYVAFFYDGACHGGALHDQASQVR